MVLFLLLLFVGLGLFSYWLVRFGMMMKQTRILWIGRIGLFLCALALAMMSRSGLLVLIVALVGVGRLALDGWQSYARARLDEGDSEAGETYQGGYGTRGARKRTNMSRKEALAVLGLTDPVTEEEIEASWKRLIQQSHPDKGGSDWIAAKLNEAREVLR